MVIPTTPVKRLFKKQIREQQDVIKKPFAFMPGEQAVFASAREALFHGIRLLGNSSGKVHVPAYCCRSLLLPIEQLKLEVKFYDVDRKLEPVIDNKRFDNGDIFLLIHYFGIPQHTLYINRLCREFKMLLVEDCAHTLPDPKTEIPLGSSGAFSIFSLRKLLPVSDGGVLVVNESDCKERMKNLLPSRVSKISMKRWLVTSFDRLSFSLGCSRAFFLKDGLKKVFGSTDNVFTSRINEESMPEFSCDTATVLCQTDFKAIANVRRKHYNYLSEKLSEIHEITVPFPVLPQDAVPQAFPVLVENTVSFCAFLRKKGIGAGRWPDMEIPEHISWVDFPGSLRWIDTLILLPLHQDLDHVHLEKIILMCKKAL